MRTALLTSLVLALASATPRADDDPEPPGSKTRELKALQGTWELRSIRVGGQKGAVPPPVLGQIKLTLTVTRDKVKMNQTAFDEEKESTIKIDPSRKPMHIDMTDKAGKTTRGIYKIEKGEWHIASFPQPGCKDRPKTFDEDKVVVIILKKPTK